MAQQGKPMRVGARKVFAYDSVKLVSLANDNRNEVDSITFFPSGKGLHPFSVYPFPNSDLCSTYLYLLPVPTYPINCKKISIFMSIVQVCHSVRGRRCGTRNRRGGKRAQVISLSFVWYCNSGSFQCCSSKSSFLCVCFTWVTGFCFCWTCRWLGGWCTSKNLFKMRNYSWSDISVHKYATP